MRTAVWLVLLIALAACGGPSKTDYAELVKIHNTELTNVKVSAVRRTHGNWKKVVGTAEFHEDMWKPLNNHSAPVECSEDTINIDPDYPIGWYRFGEAQKRLFGDKVPTILKPTFKKGDEVTLDIEFVASKAKPGETSKVSSRGWIAGAYGGGYTIEETSHLYAGKIQSHWDFETAIVVGSTEFQDICDVAGAIPAG